MAGALLFFSVHLVYIRVEFTRSVHRRNVSRVVVVIVASGGQKATNISFLHNR